jgi:polyferredoxin
MINTVQQRRVRLDLLQLPVIGPLLRWKHNRTVAQFVLFALAAAIIIDGLLGSPLAAKNVATVSAWVHYRGLVVLALLLAGNLFCAACPFVLPRKLAKWLGRPTRRWPQALRNKWLALAGLVLIIYSYELFDLWASPWWTAWLTVAYFGVAFVLEAFFTRNSFCMYVCPLGTFNFLYSAVSPLQITSRNVDVCRDCEGHECINGSSTQQGCQLELFVPTIQSNMNCTLCLDCVKACPYDNVALAARIPGNELFRQTWRNRLDLAWLAIVAAFIGLGNAFGMTPPVYVLEQQLADLLNTQSEALVLGLIYFVGAVAGPLLLVYLAAWLSRRLATSAKAPRLTLHRLVMRHAYSFVPLGFAIWMAHYLFHFLTGAMTIVPAFQTFFQRTLRWPILGEPDWQLATYFVPAVSTIQVWQSVITYGGLLAALALSLQAARHAQRNGRRALLEALPWLLLLIALAVASGTTFLLPMEMRGSAIGG